MSNVFKNAEKYLGGILFMGIIVLCFTQVLARFVFKASAGWVEEYEIFLFIWFVYLGSSACVVEDKHVCVEMLVNHYPPLLRLISDLLCIGLWITVCAVVFWESLTVVNLNLVRGAATVIAKLPYWIGQLAVPVGMVLMTLRLLLRIPRTLRRYGSEKKEVNS